MVTCERDFQPYIRRYTSPNKNFEYGYPQSNALLQSRLKLEHCKPHKAAHHPTKCDIINDVKLFLTVYRRIHCCKFLTLSNQKLHYKSKCIRILFYREILGSFIYSFLASGNFCHLLMTFAKSLDPDQDRQNVGPDPDLNTLTLL